MFCPTCGTKSADGAKFCPGCGGALGNGNAGAQGASTNTQPAAVQAVPMQQANHAAPQQSVGPYRGAPQQVYTQGAPAQYPPQAMQGGYAPYPSQAARPENSIKEMFFSFEGRLNRQRYLLRALALGFVNSIIAFVLESFMMGAFLSGSSGTAIVIGLLLLLIFVFFMIIGISLGVRRCHDLDKSGWYLLAGILIIPGLYLIFAKGTEGQNQYGPDPLQQPG